MKKVLSVLVSVCMCIGMLPAPVIAAGTNATDTVATYENELGETAGTDIAESEYGLYVGGNPVTSSNKADILGDGKVSYDGSTLTINGATIKGANSSDERLIAGVYSSNHLNIKISGTVTITSGTYVETPPAVEEPDEPEEPEEPEDETPEEEQVPTDPTLPEDTTEDPTPEEVDEPEDEVQENLQEDTQLPQDEVTVPQDNTTFKTTNCGCSEDCEECDENCDINNCECENCPGKAMQSMNSAEPQTEAEPAFVEEEVTYTEDLGENMDEPMAGNNAKIYGIYGGQGIEMTVSAGTASLNITANGGTGIGVSDKSQKIAIKMDDSSKLDLNITASTPADVIPVDENDIPITDDVSKLNDVDVVPQYAIKVSKGANSSLANDSGELTQNVARSNAAIKKIVVEPNSGYTFKGVQFPDSDSTATNNGITVTMKDDSITLEGTLTDNYEVSLPSAVSTSSDKITVTIKLPNNTSVDADLLPDGAYNESSKQITQEVEVGQAITGFTVKADTGYYFPSNYASLKNSTGIKIERDIDNDIHTIKIYGTPSKSEDITLAEVKAEDLVKVTVELGSSMTAYDEKSLVQTVNSDETIKTITINANKGYIFPSKYATVGTVNGITVDRVSESQLVIYGSPNLTYSTSDNKEIIIRLDDAVKLDYYQITIEIGSNMKVTGGAEKQTVNKGDEMDDVTIEANDGYYFNDDMSIFVYTRNGTVTTTTTLGKDINGITVIKKGTSKLIISGEPEDDISLEISPATRSPLTNADVINPGDSLTPDNIDWLIRNNKNLTVTDIVDGGTISAVFDVKSLEDISRWTNSDVTFEFKRVASDMVNIEAYNLTVTSAGKQLPSVSGVVLVTVPSIAMTKYTAVVTNVDGVQEHPDVTRSSSTTTDNYTSLSIKLKLLGKIEVHTKMADYVDVAAGSWYEEGVEWADMNGYMSPAGALRFGPDSSYSRADTILTLYKVMVNSTPVSNGSIPFTDVSRTSDYYDAVVWAYTNKITYGTSDTSFSPDGMLTRAQVVTLLYRISGSPRSTSNSQPFEDVDEKKWYYDGVVWAHENNITIGADDKKFSGDTYCTKAQIAVLLHRYFTTMQTTGMV